MKYWKIPIIYAGLIASGYYIYENQKEYNHYKEAYLKNIDDNSFSKYPEYPVLHHNRNVTVIGRAKNINLSNF